MTPDWRAIVRRELPSLDVRRDTEILDELAQHLSDLHDEAIATGQSPDDAVAVAVRALSAERERLVRGLASAGAPPSQRLAHRWSVSGDVRRDVAYAIRTLRRSPGYTLVALLTLAIGIGATSAIFAAVDAILLRPMPYAHADRLFVPVTENLSRNSRGGSVSFADYTDWKQSPGIFAAVALWRSLTLDLNGTGDPQRITVAQVSPEYFSVFTLTPEAGRTFVPADHDPSAARVTVVTHEFWQRQLGGAADAVGQVIRVSGTPVEVIGILPPRLIWPEDVALFLPMRPALFEEDVRTRRDNLIFQAVARLRDGVTAERADAFLATIAARVEREHPESRKGFTNRLEPLRSYIVAPDVRRALWVLLAAVGAVLLIGCANLAHLGLVRALARTRELSVRVALGASRWRIVRQLTVESLVVAVMGAAAGTLLAFWMTHALVAIAPEGTPFLDRIGLNLRVLAAIAATTTVSLVLTGLVPAIATSRQPLMPGLKEGSPSAGSSGRVHLLRQALIIGEVAGAVVLLVGAALLVRSFSRVLHVDPGVDVSRVLTARLALPGARYPRADDAQRFYTRLIDRLEAAPGVEAAGATSFVPIGGGGFDLGRVFLTEGAPEPPGGPDTSAQWNVVTPDYFRSVGIPVLQGRAFTRNDRAESPLVAVVSRSFAEGMFGSTASVIGKRIRSWRDENKYREIVGIVDEVRYTRLAEREVSRQVYVPHTQNSWGLMNVTVRAANGSPAALESVLRHEIAAIDPNLAVSNIATLETVAQKSVATERYTTILLSLLAATALALGAIGIYGVIGHAVSARLSELGLRAALGASPGQLYAIVFKQGLWFVGLGLAIGVAGALALSRAIQALLFETAPHDPIAYIVTVAMLIVVASLACFGPARRAAKVDPLTALRTT